MKIALKSETGPQGRSFAEKRDVRFDEVEGPSQRSSSRVDGCVVENRSWKGIAILDLGVEEATDAALKKSHADHGSMEISDPLELAINEITAAWYVALIVEAERACDEKIYVALRSGAESHKMALKCLNEFIYSTDIEGPYKTELTVFSHQNHLFTERL